MSVSLQAVYARSERMVGRRIADEYVLVPLVGRGAEIDGLYNLSRVGTFIWERLDGTADGQAIVSSLVDRFDVERPRAEQDYREFIEKLLSIAAVRNVEAK
jgi:hypothetical protein